jgi:hypothetical protein
MLAGLTPLPRCMIIVKHRDKWVKKVFFADEDMGDDEDTDSKSTPQAWGKKREGS